jgi:hypothetical protein
VNGPRHLILCKTTMGIITFAEPELQKKAIGFLLGRFSGHALQSGEVIVPEAALAALAPQDLVFTVHGKASYPWYKLASWQ